MKAKQVKETTMTLTEDEMLTIMDWFNGYTARYYGFDPETISQKLPDNHKKLIDKILKKCDEEFSTPLSEKELEILTLEQEDDK